MEVPENLTELMAEGKENSSQNGSQKSAKEDDQPKVFMLSGVPDEDRKEFQDFLDSKGVAYSTSATCDAKVSLLILYITYFTLAL